MGIAVSQVTGAIQPRVARIMLLVDISRAGLGRLDARTITQQTVYAYKDHRLNSTTNSTTPIQVRKEIRHFSAMMSMAIEWGVICSNPCKGVRLGADPKRNRYMTDDELLAFRDFAQPMIANYLDIKLLTALRKVDILGIRLEDLREDGIHITPSKTAKTTGKKLIIEWTPALRETVGRILDRKLPKVQRLDLWRHLFCTRDGKPYAPSGFNSIWQREKRKALGNKVINREFH